MLDARAIANFILDEFDPLENEISNKKINKLIYFGHGFSMLRLQLPLITNHVEAWAHGPVVKVVYEAFKQFEFRPITARATCFNYLTDKEEVVSYDELTDSHRQLTRKVVQHFVRYSADDLEDMTHTQFGPWSKVWNTPVDARGLRSRIPDEEILHFFKKKYGANTANH
ncbi:MAG: DUF4065 domain-containing protein [Hyphomicrobiales bacterium]